MNPGPKRFRVAISFPGERRDFVAQVAELLAAKLGRERILYDAWYEAEFARPRLATYLPTLYREQAELVAAFLCADYQDKEWCGLEWDAIFDLIKRGQESAIMLLRFDNVEIPGLFSTHGYVWIANHSAEDVVRLILERLQINLDQQVSASVPLQRSDSIGASAPVPPTKPIDQQRALGQHNGQKTIGIDRKVIVAALVLVPCAALLILLALRPSLESRNIDDSKMSSRNLNPEPSVSPYVQRQSESQGKVSIKFVDPKIGELSLSSARLEMALDLASYGPSVFQQGSRSDGVLFPFDRDEYDVFFAMPNGIISRYETKPVVMEVDAVYAPLNNPTFELCLSAYQQLPRRGQWRIAKGDGYVFRTAKGYLCYLAIVATRRGGNEVSYEAEASYRLWMPELSLSK